MIFMGNAVPTFTPAVGVAPATSTLTIPGPQSGLGTTYSPYASIEDLRSSSGLGLITETDAWLTGRPYGLPGTAAIRFDSSEPYGAGMLGSAPTTEAQAMISTYEAQQAQTAALRRIAFWQAVVGTMTVASAIAVVGSAIMWARR